MKRQRLKYFGLLVMQHSWWSCWLYSDIVINFIIFQLALKGLNYEVYIEDTLNSVQTETQPWYDPLYDSNSGIVFEGFIILFIII